MDYLKYYLLNIILLYSFTNLFSQNIGIQLDRNQGIIESIYIKKDKIIFELDSSNTTPPDCLLLLV